MICILSFELHVRLLLRLHATRVTIHVKHDGGLTHEASVDCSRNAYNQYSRRRAGKVYPHEIDIQETDTKHRKLDSEAPLSHPTADGAADGLCPQASPLRASGGDHDPGGLPPWPAGLGGLRPAMAADRTLRGPPACSPGQERNPQCAPNPG